MKESTRRVADVVAGLHTLTIVEINKRIKRLSDDYNKYGDSISVCIIRELEDLREALAIDHELNMTFIKENL